MPSCVARVENELVPGADLLAGVYVSRFPPVTPHQVADKDHLPRELRMALASFGTIFQELTRAFGFQHESVLNQQVCALLRSTVPTWLHPIYLV